MAVSMKALRVNANLTQEEIARKMGISRDLYNQIENGKVDAKPVYIYAFCQLIGCTPDDISTPEMSTK